MENVGKNEVSIEMAEKKEERNGVVVVGRRKNDAMHVVARLVCLVTSLCSLSVMVTAKQRSTISLYGFSIPVYSNWSFSDSFESVSLSLTHSASFCRRRLRINERHIVNRFIWAYLVYNFHIACYSNRAYFVYNLHMLF